MDERVSVNIRALVWRDGRVLLGEQYPRPGWRLEHALPGGKGDPNETILNTAWRELFEETAMRGKRVERLPVWNYQEYPELGIHFVTVYATVTTTDDPVNMEPDKCAGWHWFKPDALPANTNAGAVEAITACL